jgi:hypothetical protein
MAYTQQMPIGTPDVNLITKTLAGLRPDSALQQYAALHKNNPYILSLAKLESDRRKSLRLAAQGQNAGQMPTVVDQNIAGMAQQQLPEDQGIAQIPTPNIQRMADGGIAGYEDDEEGMATGGMGGMFNFAQQSEPVVRMSGGGHIPRYQGNTTDGSVVTSGDMYTQQLALRAKYEKEATEMSEGKRMQFSPDVKAYAQQLYKASNAPQVDYVAKEQQRSLAGNPLQNKTAPAVPAVPDRFKNPEVTSADSTGMGMGMPTGVGLPAGTDVSALKQPAYVPAGTQPPPPPAPTTQQGLGSIPSSKVITPEQAKEQAGNFIDFEESRTALRKAETDQESQGARMRTMLADSLPKTPALQGLEKLLDKQDAETGGEKDKAAGLALLSAGLAIAGGSSQFALQNLKEAIPAVTQYGEALKDIKKMERENMKMRGEIEQARRAESRDDTKLKLQLEEKIGDRKDKINELGIGLTSKIAGTTAEVASKLWSTSYEAVNRKEVAGISALAGANAELNKYAQIGAADPNSALAKGFQMYKQEGAEPRLYGEYIKLSRDPIDGAAFREKYPTFDIFKSGYSGSAMQFAAPPANAAILKPPKG